MWFSGIVRFAEALRSCYTHHRDYAEAARGDYSTWGIELSGSDEGLDERLSGVDVTFYG